MFSPAAAVVLDNLKEEVGCLVHAATKTIKAVAVQKIKKFFFIKSVLVFLLVRLFGFRLEVGLHYHPFPAK
jgi:hypothetical protein